MAMAQDLNVMFNVEQTLLRGGQVVVARQEISGESLGVPAEEWSPWAERLAEEIVRTSCLRGAMRRRGPISRVLRSGIVPELGVAGLHL